MSTHSANTNGKHQSSSPINRNSDELAYSPTLKDHLKEDYDHYKNFLVNGNDTNTDRSQAMSQSLRSWEEIWDRAKSGAKNNQVKPKI